MYTCQACGKPRLKSTEMLELGPDDFSDERHVELLKCGACSATAIGFYEESRRGSSERWHHDAWLISAERYDELYVLFAACPAFRDSDCRCPGHRKARVGCDDDRKGDRFKLVH